MIFNIIGGSGSGKTTLKFALTKTGKFRGIVPCTTRPMRRDEVDGLHYHFVSWEIFAKQEFIISRIANGSNYGVRKEDLLCVDDSRIVVTTFDVDGIISLLRMGIDVRVLFLNINYQEREKRMLLRGDDKNEIAERLQFNSERLTSASLGCSVLTVREATVAEHIRAVKNFIGID